ncbi:ATP-binding protein [Nostoc parmelioides]|uniref:histidine kinase n=1 Tax=Nostoc parmelioides FACHB-3921 TaxID=2692909 RepID=A0ABR8B993_9NOSO|nr:HAMP domain-containing histidine kinase [Nostoc parmelioides FACHB-3921]
MNNIKKNWINIDPFSLQLRLTVGMASFSALVLGSLATWTSWRMQQILIDSRKHEVEQIAKRLPQDVQLYSKMMQADTSLQKAINNFANTNTLIWFKNSNSKIISRTDNLDLLPESLVTKLMKLTQMPIKAQVYQINPSYFVVCGTSIKVQGKLLGELFVVKDITREQTMFVAMVRSLGITSILAIIILTIAIAFYIRRSLQPLRQLSQMTAVISAEDLGQAQLYLDNAPSEVKELAQTLTMLLSRLAQSWEQEREFVSNVSHELRTPLTIVYGYLQSVLRRQNNLTPLQQEALEIAASEAERTIRLLQDLLDLARADSGYLYFQMKTYVLNDIIAEIVVMAEKYSDRLITIESTIFPIEVKVDYSRFKQVLLNLIDNAVKYSEADTPITFKLDQLQDTAIIQVCDQGYGIPLQHQARIFERFYRIDESRSQATGGCGLGLSIVKTLVEGMGGSVSVQSKLGEGSIFTIILPR